MIKYLQFEYFFILIIIIWIPFQQFILKVDGSNTSISILVLFAIAQLINKKYFYSNGFKNPLKIWFIWVICAFIIYLIKGNSAGIPFHTFFILIFVPFILMAVISIEYIRNAQRLLNVLIISFYIAIILILSFVQVLESGRMGGEMNSNTIGMTATVLIMLLYLKFFYRNYSLPVFIFLLIIPFIAVISAGSRTAFGGVIILVFVHFFIRRKGALSLLKVGLGISLILLPMSYLIKNTNLGERISTTAEQSEGMAFQTGNPILDKFGDRGYFYYRGWQVFKGNPIIGVGLGNFNNFNEFEYAQHSEYMIQLSELGLIGFTLFTSFYFSIFKNLFRIKKIVYNMNRKREVELYTSYIIIILIMITATRMYRVWFLFVIVGIVIGYINKNKSKNLHKSKELT